MDMEFINGKMDKSMKGSMSMVSGKTEANIHIQMELSMMDNGSMVSRKVKGQ